MKPVHQRAAIGRRLGVLWVAVAWRAPVRNLAKYIDLDLVNVDPGADPELFANAMLGSGEFQSGLAHCASP